MVVLCEKCGIYYDDESRWTICPHGPLWAGVKAYCRKHDLVNCFICEEQMHPSVEAVLQFFEFEHLPQHLQDVSKPFAELAKKVADGPQNAETTVALRKLLEAKDCAVRATLVK